MSGFDDFNMLSEERYFSHQLDDLIAWAESIAAEWDGDNPGSKEDRAHQAGDIIEKAQELQEFIKGMGEL